MGTLWSRRRLVVAGVWALSGRGLRGFIDRDVPTTTAGVSTPAASPQATPVRTGSPPAESRSDSPVSVAGEVVISLTDDGFRPSVVQSTNGHDLKIKLVNSGTRNHAFQITRLDVDVVLEPGEQETVIIKRPPLGDFHYTSDQPGDEKMEGTLIFYI